MFFDPSERIRRSPTSDNSKWEMPVLYLKR